MPKLSLYAFTCCLVPTLFLAAPMVRACAEESDGPKREVIRGQRPDESRGWFVVSKESYWPLCYESLDTIEEAQRLIGSGNQKQLADVLEKCGAWLKLAASAAVADGKSGVADVGHAFQFAGESVADGSSDWSEQDLQNLTTLGLVAMARSHVLRAAEPDENFKAQRGARTIKSPSAELNAAQRDINRGSVERTVAQFRYDAWESFRHLKVAQTYLTAAAKSGGFSVDDEMVAEIPELTVTDTYQTSLYVIDELRPRIESMGRFLSQQQKQLRQQLSDKL